jgi:hypothetical protein
VAVVRLEAGAAGQKAKSSMSAVFRYVRLRSVKARKVVVPEKRE